jgi:E3 ubiquitin-protein ligase makorin
MSTPCKFYAIGRCYKGDQCVFTHKMNETEIQIRAEEVKHSKEAECGICYDQITSKFGLLRCHCAFCFDCIKLWRSKGHDIAQKSTVRLCPVCRTESFEVIPSEVLVTDPDRKKLLSDSYRAARCKTVCKNFNITRPWCCRFGRHCAYAHLMPDGSPVPPQFYVRPKINEFAFDHGLLLLLGTTRIDLPSSDVPIYTILI